MSTKSNSVLVIFDESLKKNEKQRLKSSKKYSFVISPKALKEEVEVLGHSWASLEEYSSAGSIYEAGEFVKELSLLCFPNGKRIAKSFIYKGYEMWWINYNSLYLNFGLPYSRYKEVLKVMTEYEQVLIYNPKYRDLFSHFLKAHNKKLIVISKPGFRGPKFMPFGLFVQILLTLLFLPIIIIQKKFILVFIGDRFDKNKDYDARMKFIYKELRNRKLPFVEIVRSLESWKTILKHTIIRKRPVLYSEALTRIGIFLSFISRGRSKGSEEFSFELFNEETNRIRKFKYFVATHHLRKIYDDVWGIRIMNWIIKNAGIKATYVTAAMERNFHTVIASKLNNYPVIGIMHGVTSYHFTATDFLPTYDGEKKLSVDKYGVWSKWWKEYYLENGAAFKKDQLVVSGPMRPYDLSIVENKTDISPSKGPIKILFISEQLAVPEEALPYLEELLKLPPSEFKFTYRFRPYRDGFEDWLKRNKPELLDNENVSISSGELQEAIKESDVVVGSHSTAVVESLFQNRVPILYKTNKWGDYFELKQFHENHPFFAEDPKELIERIKNSRALSTDTQILLNLRERFFGDVSKNGSKWVVDELENALLKDG